MSDALKIVLLFGASLSGLALIWAIIAYIKFIKAYNKAKQNLED